MKKMTCFAVLAAMAIGIAGCGAAAPAATETPATEATKAVTEQATETAAAETTVPAGDVGKYVIYEYTAGDTTVGKDMLETAGMGDTWIELKDDGTGQFKLYEELLDITWKDGTITVYGTSDYTYDVDGDTLTLDMQGVTYVLKRDGSAAKETAEKTTEKATEKEATTETAAAEPAATSDAPGGDGLVSEEAVQKGYVWMSKVNKDIFNATYEDIVAYFGTDGEFDKEEFNDHMQQNRRYYKWISTDDDTHYIYVNFGEKDPENAPGVYKVTGFNSSGFTSAEAEEKYLEELQAGN